MKIIRIALTGGPGGGKSKAISLLKKRLLVENKENEFRLGEYRCLFMGETASELIKGGVKPDGCNYIHDFQFLLFRIQMEKEAAFNYAARNMPDDKYIIFYDRGLIDGGAYITDEEYLNILRRNGIHKIEEIYQRYDHVISFDTPENFYTTDNNIARTEDIDTALAVNKRTIELWQNHPDFHILGSYENYEDKFDAFMKLIKDFI